jgi:hypothetical protein
MRVAETRAVNRALRKAYGIGICSVEEIGFDTSGRASGLLPSSTNSCENKSCAAMAGNAKSVAPDKIYRSTTNNSAASRATTTRT